MKLYRKFSRDLRKSAMPRGKSSKPKGPPVKRGPYKSEIIDPDQLGTEGIRLRQHRQWRGWTLDVLAERAGLSKGTIQAIEAAKGGYSPETLKKLSDALGVTIGELFDVDPRQDAPQSSIWPLWQQADQRQRERITDYATGVVGHKK